MTKGVKQQQLGPSENQRRRMERLGAELRANLKKRKAATRDQQTVSAAGSAPLQDGEKDPVT